MIEPIKNGDLCIVISGMKGDKSPNIGLIVTVIHRVYECPQLGAIWRCEAEYAIREFDDRITVPAGLADFAQSWLKKIKPDGIMDKSKIKEEELV